MNGRSTKPAGQSRRRLRFAFTTLAAVLVVSSGPAMAGMPSLTVADVPRYLTLTDITRERLQAISFFVVGFLVAVALVRWSWNALAKDFPLLPRISYPRATALVGVWGLLFLLVLTMISGARELMTPGAWVKDGLTYKLAAPAEPISFQRDEQASRDRLGELHARLADFAQQHEGRFPADRKEAGLRDSAWYVPGTAGISYLYLGDRPIEPGSSLLACEPALIADPRLVLLADGTIRHWQPDDESFMRLDD